MCKRPRENPAVGGLIRCGGDVICGSKQNASETIDNIRQDENLFCENKKNVWYYSSIYSLKKICTLNRTPLAQKSESTHSERRAYAREGLYKESLYVE